MNGRLRLVFYIFPEFPLSQLEKEPAEIAYQDNITILTGVADYVLINQEKAITSEEKSE